MPPRRSLRLKKCSSEGNQESCMTVMPYLHHDIWFYILSWFSALCLHNIFKRVCKSWAAIISHPDFVDTQLRRSTYGILIRDLCKSSYRFLELVNNNVEITEIDLKTKRLGQLCFTYQGVMLFRSTCTNDNHYAINPVTKQIAKMYQSEIPKDMYDASPYYNVIRDRRSGEYKLVLSFGSTSNELGWYVRKLGSGNKWDKIITTKERFAYPGLAVGGFLCFTMCRQRKILILDVSDETVCKISWPGGYSPETFLPMGNAATLSSISFDSERIFIHVLTNLHAENWSLYHIIDIQSLYRSQWRATKPPGFQFFLGWINNNEELVGRLCTFRSCSELGSCYKSYNAHRSPCSEKDYRLRIGAGAADYWEDRWIYFTYNLKTKHTRYLDSHISQENIVKVHTNSLVSW